MPRAVVVGGTGAIGRELVGLLLTDGHWDRVITVGRREVTVSDSYPPSGFKAQLEQVVVNMDNLEQEAADAFKDADDVFCTLGTIRKEAGSAQDFVKVDLGYVAKTAQAAKAGGAKHFSLVTAAGANAKMWANDMGIFHGLLYCKTKGQAEEAVKAQGLPHVSIYRPGMLLRGDLARGNEKLWMNLFSSSSKIEVAHVAKCMVQIARQVSAEPRQPVTLYTMKAMVSASRSETFLPVGEVMK